MDVEAYLDAVRAVSHFYTLRGDPLAAVVFRRAQHSKTLAEHERYVAPALDSEGLPEALRALLEDCPAGEPA